MDFQLCLFVSFFFLRVNKVVWRVNVGNLVTDLAYSGMHVNMLSPMEQMNQIKGWFM